MFCSNCGNQIPEDATFCSKCGAKLISKEEAEANINNNQLNINNTNNINNSNINSNSNFNNNSNINNNSNNNYDTYDKEHLTTSQFREQARQALTGKWGKAAAMILVYGLIEFAITFIINFVTNLASIVANEEVMDLVARLINLIISVPIGYGFLVSFIKLKRGHHVKLTEFFTTGLTNFSKVWEVALNVLLKMLPAVIAFILMYVGAVALMGVGSMQSVTIKYTFGSSVSSTSGGIGLIILGFVLLIASYIPLYISSLNYVIANNILFDEPNLKGKEIAEKSREIMKHRRGDYFVLTLSFIGWALLVPFTLGIGLFWLTPYIMVAQICFYDYVKQLPARD